MATFKLKLIKEIYYTCPADNSLIRTANMFNSLTTASITTVVQEFGHLSYNCPHNMLGDREPPPKKKKKKSKAGCDDHKPCVAVVY